MDIKDEKIAIPIVLIAGLFWSFGPLVIRYADQPELVPWQYLFARGLIIFIILNFYLYLNEGTHFVKNYLRIGLSGMVGSVGLASAMMSFIWSITHTSVAITLLCLAAMPLITGLLGFIFLKEKIPHRFSPKISTSFLFASSSLLLLLLLQLGRASCRERG